MKKIYTQDMKIKLLKRTGRILLLCALVGLGISATNMITIISDETIDSHPVLAEAISGTLLPATNAVIAGTPPGRIRHADAVRDSRKEQCE